MSEIISSDLDAILIDIRRYIPTDASCDGLSDCLAKTDQMLARRCCETHLASYGSSYNFYGLGLAYMQLAVLGFRGAGDASHPKILDHIQQAIEVFRIRDIRCAGLALMTLGRYHEMRGCWRAASDAYLESVSILVDQRDALAQENAKKAAKWLADLRRRLLQPEEPPADAAEEKTTSSQTEPDEKAAPEDVAEPSAMKGEAPEPSATKGAAPEPPATKGAAPEPPTLKGAAPEPPALKGEAPEPPATKGAAPEPPATKGAAPEPPALKGEAPEPPATKGAAPESPALKDEAPEPPALKGEAPEPRRDPDESGGVAFAFPVHTLRVRLFPVGAERVAAGAPIVPRKANCEHVTAEIFSIAGQDTYLRVDFEGDREPRIRKYDFALPVRGSSMENTIHDGEFVLVRRIEAVPGDIVVVRIPDGVDEDRFTVKRLYRERDHVRLSADNPKEPDIVIVKKENQARVIQYYSSLPQSDQPRIYVSSRATIEGKVSAVLSLVPEEKQAP